MVVSLKVRGCRFNFSRVFGASGIRQALPLEYNVGDYLLQLDLSEVPELTCRTSLHELACHHHRRRRRRRRRPHHHYHHHQHHHRHHHHHHYCHF